MADSNQEEALSRLLQLLRLPSSPEQEAEVMRFLSSNPSLMAAFINHRGQQEQPGDRGGKYWSRGGRKGQSGKERAMMMTTRKLMLLLK